MEGSESMIKNGIIAILISALWHTTMCEFNVLTLICFASILFFVVWSIEETIREIKRKKSYQRRINRRINNIKITPNKPTKAS
jgi:hypothetical protein